MTETETGYFLDFPLACCEVIDETDAVRVWLREQDLQRLENVLAALRLGLAECEPQPAGEG